MRDMLLFTAIAGLAIPAGGLLARLSWLLPRWADVELRHSVLAAGGGILVGTAALSLVPHGLETVGFALAIGLIAAGGLVFCGIDILLARAQSEGAQLLAMLADFVPESLAVGAAFASGSEGGRTLAILIAAQNLPEAFNAFREAAPDGSRAANLLLGKFLALATLGPIAGLGAHLWLGDAPAVIGGIMLFVSGGILFLTFQDIAPQVRLERHWSPPLAAVGGFLIAVAAQHLGG